MSIIRIRYGDACTVCGSRVFAGTLADWEYGKGVRHEECAQKEKKTTMDYDEDEIEMEDAKPPKSRGASKAAVAAVATEKELEKKLKKVPITVGLNKNASAEHKRITNKLGLIGAQPITDGDLEAYLFLNHYDVYPESSVAAFMDAKVKAIADQVAFKNEYKTTVKTKWRWQPIRNLQSKIGGVYYNKPVPVEVLSTVEKIFNDLGDQVIFEATDIYQETTSLYVDPFLCVTAPGCSRFIIERWDEPAYRR